MSAAEARSLYRALIREGQRFTNYNLRCYVRRRAREMFEEGRTAADAEAARLALEQGKQELELVKRQATIQNMYAHYSSIVEVNKKKSA